MLTRPPWGPRSGSGCQRRTPALHGALCSKAPFGQSLFPLEDKMGQLLEECCPPAKHPPPLTPLLPHGWPWPGLGHSQAECSQTISIPTSWDCAGGCHTALQALGYPTGCPGPGGPAWVGRKDFASPLPLFAANPTCNNRDVTKGAMAPRCQPVPLCATLCHPSDPCHRPTGRTWDPRPSARARGLW